MMNSERKEVLKKKGIALLGLFAVGLVVSLMSYKYFYFLDAFFYTYEFYWMFNVNNLQAANTAMFVDYFRPMGIATEALPQVILSHLIQNYYLPFTKPILVASATSAYGMGLGLIFSFFGFLAVGFISYGIGNFFLGDIVPYIKGSNLNTFKTKINKSTLVGLPVLFAIPWLPISAITIGSAFIKVPVRRSIQLMSVGVALRLFLLLAIPSLFL